MNKTKIAIIGASGYAARELFRILLGHPQVEITAATSRQDESPAVAELHPSLNGRIDLACETYSADRIAEKAEIAFLALPHAASMAVAPELLVRGLRVIDLSADYRLRDPAVYADWYGHDHSDADRLASAVYGLPELFRSKIPAASLIANPGCYTSTSILALAPLLAQKLIDPSTIIIDAKSGVSGAGRSPKLNYHFPECNESFTAYSVGRHRHTPEIEQILSEIAQEPVQVLFTPHLVPMDRGIFTTIYAQPLRPVHENDLLELYQSFYAGEPFVRIRPSIPATKDTAHTNFFDLTARIVRGKILLLATLDNLIKGAAGVAVQNLNLMLGFPESTALL